MASEFSVKIQGLEELTAILRGLPDKLRRRALRNALAAGARIVRDAAKRATPVLKRSTYAGASALRRGVRNVGTVQKAIAVRTSKQATRRGDVGVFVNVRPARKGSRGTKNPNDPFYWRFLEFGWNPAGFDRSSTGKAHRRRLGRQGAPKAKPGAHFLQQGATKLSAALEKFKSVLGPQIARLNTNPKDPL